MWANLPWKISVLVRVLSVVVKHVQYIKIIRVFSLSGGGPCKVFQCQLGQKKLLGFGLLGGISTQSDAMFLLNQAF